MNKLKITNPGLLTTLQDRGRWGYQQYGVSVGGVMDLFSMETANRLVGNDPSEGVLEMTLMGLDFEVQGKALIAVCGAEMEGTVNGEALPLWSSVLLEDGDQVSFTPAKKGVRAYLAVSGGFKVPLVLGSKSTYTRAKMGGFEGRKLEAGDELEIGDMGEGRELFSLSPDRIPKIPQPARIRVVLGPQDDFFTPEGLETFLSSEYTITPESDRMGYRLKGKEIIHKDRADIISDGIIFGAVQVAGNGQPTIMLADRQTTGGYTKIATVISPDLPLLAQLGPGSVLTFESLSPDQAHEVYLSWRKDLDRISESFIPRENPEEKEDWDMDKIKQLIEQFNESRLTGLDLSMGDLHLTMKKGEEESDFGKEKSSEKSPGPSNAGEGPRPAKGGSGKRSTRPASKEKAKPDQNPPEKADIIEVRAPIAGVCYASPSEGEPPFVQAGDPVKKGQTLMILEVMKMMNEIRSPEEGKILAIHFENEQKLDQGALLFTIEPKK